MEATTFAALGEPSCLRIVELLPPKPKMAAFGMKWCYEQLDGLDQYVWGRST